MVKALTARSSQEKERARLVARGFSGPLPHPSILQQYDLATRKVIVDMAYKQSVHRQFLEKSVVTSNIANEQTGMWISACITIFMIGGGIYLLMHDKDGVGFTLIFGMSLFQAGNYIYNKYQEKQVGKTRKYSKVKN